MFSLKYEALTSIPPCAIRAESSAIEPYCLRETTSETSRGVKSIGGCTEFNSDIVIAPHKR